MIGIAAGWATIQEQESMTSRVSFKTENEHEETRTIDALLVLLSETDLGFQL